MIERCFWTETTDRFVPRPAELPERTDVAIVGGGYTGVAAARALGRHGANVTVLERETVGWGASTRNGGFVLPGFKLGAEELLVRFGPDRARALFQQARDSVLFLESVIAEEGIACDYARCGHLSAAAKPSHFRAMEHDRRVLAGEFGHQTEIISPAELHTELGSDRFHGGLLDPFAGSVHPAKLFAGLAAAAAKAGARLLEGAEVLGIRGSHGSFEVTTSRGKLAAGEVLIATNGYGGAVHPDLLRRVIPIGSYIIATAPLDQAMADRLIPKRRVVNDTLNHLVYFRLSPDRRMIFGGRASFTPTPPARAAGILARRMGELFPDLAGVPVEYTWSGNVGFTRDLLPHTGVLGGLHYAAGYCGHGVAMATYLGDCVGQSLAGMRGALPLAAVRFPTIPLYHGKPWFLPVVGAYYKVKDWIA